MNSCPKGKLCFTNVNFFGGAIIILLALYIVNKESYHKLYNKLNNIEKEIEDTRNNISDSDLKNNLKNDLKNDLINKLKNDTDTVKIDLDRDVYNDRDLVDILKPPLKREPPGRVKLLPINVKTRGDGGPYQQVGILTKESIADPDATPGNNTDSVILPLFAKPIYDGASQWNYYTATDKFHQIKVPLTINGKNCTDDQGCKELYGSESVNVPGYNGNFLVNIYKNDSPRYIPYI